MAVWRGFYTTYLDVLHMRSLGAARSDRARDMAHFVDALRAAFLLSIACCALLQVRVGGRGLCASVLEPVRAGAFRSGWP